MANQFVTTFTKNLFSTVLSITILCLCLLGGTSCVTTSGQSAGYAKPIRKIYEKQRLKNETARKSQNTGELKTALEDTEKSWLDTVFFLESSEQEKTDCQSIRKRCEGKLEVYQYLTFILAGLILVYFGLRLSPLGRFIPMLFIALLSLPMISFSVQERTLHAMELAGMTHDIKADLLSGIAYAETGSWPESRRPYLVSSAGALGYMQIKPSTAEDVCPGHNLYDKMQNIFCSAAYLKWIKRHYCRGKGNFCLAMSYRHGPTAFKRGVRLDWRYWRKVRRFLEV